MTKGELMKALQENPQSMDTPIQVYLEATNDDKGVVSLTIESLAYSKHQKAIVLNGSYEEDEY